MHYHVFALLLGLSVADLAVAASPKAEPKPYQADLGPKNTPWGMLHAYDRLRPAKTVAPQIPSSARRKGLDCELIALVLVGLDGSVTEARVQRSCGTGSLDDAAVLALKHWKYRLPVPGERCVSVQPMTFSIE